MLQQTQVATVLPYYERFLQHFPDLDALAAAPLPEVMALWSGLGYYARARNLHACAQAVMREHGGRFPHDADSIVLLPGIGRSTANSIATFCFGAQAPIMDGNVKRVLCRAFGIEGFPGTGAVEKQLWALASELMPKRDGGTYNQAQMDLGATVCTRTKPRCDTCPLRRHMRGTCHRSHHRTADTEAAQGRSPARSNDAGPAPRRPHPARSPPAHGYLGRPAVAAGAAGGRRGWRVGGATLRLPRDRRITSADY
jgi:A/G-specific adenine glycosylase